MRIRRLRAEAIINSLGQHTIEVTVNRMFKGSAPLGISKSAKEPKAFPSDTIPTGIVNRSLHKGLKGMKLEEFKDLEDIEKIFFEFDNTKQLTKLGSNVIIALESALLKAMSNNNVWFF